MNTANGAAVDRAPDALEPVTAWRAWFVGRESDDGSPRLHSVIHNCEWPVARKLEASCLTTRGIVSRPHPAPADGCQCGIYGTARVDGLANYVGHGLGPVPRIQAIGLVRLWGVVREHEHGWRGSRAYPCRLWLPTHDFRDEPIDNWDELALALADYGVPVEVLDGGRSHEALASLRAWQAARDHAPTDDPRTVSRFGRLR
jgi:hypothetical protein